MPDDLVSHGDAADRRDLIAGLVVLDDGLAFDPSPGVVIEGANDRSDFLGGVI